MLFQFSAFACDRIPAGLLDDVTAVCDIKAGFQVREAMAQVADFCLFLVDYDAILGIYLPELFKALPEVFHILVDQIAVVHIGAVSFYPEHFLGKVIRRAPERDRVDLAGL